MLPSDAFPGVHSLLALSTTEPSCHKRRRKGRQEEPPVNTADQEPPDTESTEVQQHEVPVLGDFR